MQCSFFWSNRHSTIHAGMYFLLKKGVSNKRVFVRIQ